MGHFYDAGAVYGEGTWHAREKLTGGVFTEPLTGTQAAQRAQMMYDMWFAPVYADVRGTAKPLSKKGVIVRGPTPWDPENRVLSDGIVDIGYQIVQVKEMAEIVDGLIPANGAKPEWPLEHVCALKKGQIVIFLMRIGGYQVGGDSRRQEHVSYLCYVNHLDGKTAAKMFVCTIRIVCYNTFRWGEDRALWTQVIHRGSSAAYHKAIGDLVVATERAKAEEAAFMNKMATIALGRTAFADFLEAAFPYQKEPSILQAESLVGGLVGDSKTEIESRITAAQQRVKYDKARADGMRDEAAWRYARFNQSEPEFAHTAYAAFNAVTAVTTHSKEWRTSEMVAAIVQPVKTKRVSAAQQWLKAYCGE